MPLLEMLTEKYSKDSRDYTLELMSHRVRSTVLQYVYVRPQAPFFKLHFIERYG